MRDIGKIEIHYIYSEPGDGTRYEFMVSDQYNDYYCIHYHSDIAYPTELNWWDIVEIKGIDDIKEFKTKFTEHSKVDDWTLLACINVIREIRKNAR